MLQPSYFNRYAVNYVVIAPLLHILHVHHVANMSQNVDEFPVILVDTREQQPYEFDRYAVRNTGLAVGDYSLEGCVELCAVERKTREDAYGCVGQSRQRFVRCLERLTQLQAPAIVIESSLKDFSFPPPRTKINAAQAVGSFISWSCQYRIPIFWCENREYAERVTLRFLMAYWKHLHHT